MPIRLLLAGGRSAPVVEEWVAGTNTALSIAGGKARATRDGVDNPRISRRISGLVPGLQYRIGATHYVGTAGLTTFYRVSSTANLTSGDYYNNGSDTNGQVLDISFTAPSGGVVYFGIVPATNNDTEYAETTEIPSVSRA